MKILVVDDERMICDGTVLRIRNMKLPYVTGLDAAYSAEEALDRLRRERYQLMFTDIRMGETDGLTLIGQARQLCPELLCVIITAYSDFAYAQQAVRLGAMDYLLKPCTIEAMARLIGKAHDLLPEAPEADGPSAGDPLRRVEDYCRAHLSEELDMASVANELDISYSYFSRVFHDRKGITFSRYVLQLKLEHVCEELRRGRKLVAIAPELGYSNPNNLTRAFTKEYGVSPSVWAAEHKDEGK